MYLLTAPEALGRTGQRLPYNASSTRAAIARDQEAALGQSIVVYRFLGLHMWFVILTYDHDSLPVRMRTWNPSAEIRSSI